MEINSPLTGKKSNKIRSVETVYITREYKEILNIDVSGFFEQLNEISLYECPQTAYQFFHPFSITGDSNFYEQLQKNDWYYMPWKWEHQQAAKHINAGDNVLEVGCAKGDFLTKIQQNIQARVTGLEMNKQAAQTAQDKKIDVFTESIEKHAEEHTEKYDIVCSFQVLEHVPEVKQFIEAQLKVLKKGGKLIVAVPNNESFLKYDPMNILNLPPHHIGLWNTKSLSSLAEIFNLEIQEIHYEPVQDYHKDWYKKTIARRAEKIVQNRLGKLPAIFKKIARKSLRTWFKISMRKGHTILVVFKKK